MAIHGFVLEEVTKPAHEHNLQACQRCASLVPFRLPGFKKAPKQHLENFVP